MEAANYKNPITELKKLDIYFKTEITKDALSKDAIFNGATLNYTCLLYTSDAADE